MTGLFYVASLLYFGVLIGYFATGKGGPTMLAVLMVPASIVILTLNDLRRGEFYPRLRLRARQGVAGLYVALAAIPSVYLLVEFDAIRIERLGIWNLADHLAAGAVILLVLEYTRRKYFPVFVLNLLLCVYAVFGWLVPGLFRHPGISWERLSSSLGLEMSTGVFERLPQLGLTLIGSFLLLLAALQAFGCIDTLLRASGRLAARSPRLLPQAAVLGSFGVGAVSGSGAANAAATGAATIPMLIRAGFPKARAAAVETASSLGGQLMPPLMGISAFLMAEVMGVSYFDVVVRGFAPAIIYFAGVALAVHLLTARFQIRPVTTGIERIRWFDTMRLFAYVGALVALVWLMGYLRLPAMLAAQQVFLGLLAVLTTVFLLETPGSVKKRLKSLLDPYRKLIGNFATTTSELTILLASLGILTAAFTVTGVPDKVGVLLMQLGGFHPVAMVAAAFVFGYLIGMGLPVAPTYIVLAVVTAPFLIQAGINPWVVHFFAFFVAIFGELSPPTSVTAAVTARIAEASFLRTMFHAIGMALPLLILTGAVFCRPDLVLEPGVAQLEAFGFILIGTVGMTFAVHGRFRRLGPKGDRLLRAILAALGLAVIFFPVPYLSPVLAVMILALVTGGLWSTDK